MYPSVNILATCLFLLFGTNLLGQDCQASFTFDETDLTIQFFDQSTSDAGDPIISWFWDFDDGSTSNQQNPTHTFPDPDKYRINLTITTASGCTSTIEIEIETCVLNTNLTIGNCDPNGMIQLTINVSDIYDNAKDIDISVDGQLIPGSPFEIDVDMPVTVNYTMTGDGLPHTLLVQSTDIGSCNTEIDFTLPDCGSNCFLSSFSVNVVGGTTHNVDVGDDFFAPVNTTISLGDIVHFQWIGDGHSTTSDATSGPDSWNSGEIGFGSTYDVNIQNPGVHPYYCIPHGSPGGQGMAGSIIANCPPSNNFTLNLNFSTSIADPAGYNVIVDGVVQAGSPFSYNGTGTQTATITLSGDGLAHQIEIQDVADPSCILSNTWNAPDCGAAPTCSLSSTLVQTGGCNVNNNVTIEVTVNSINGGAAGFNIFIDGALASGSPFSYDPSGVTVVNIEVTGDGQSHTITATDVNDSACTVDNNITTTDCSIQCVLSNINANTGTPVTHIVEVIDFDFVPKDITIAPDDIVEWQWTGVIDHTTTSDATSGPDSWESGLLNQGATFQKSGLSVGVHPYYCIPHGSPGGVGMAGTITVQASCTNNMVAVAVSFNEVGGSFDGFEVLVDGIVSGTFSYDPSGSNTVSVNVQGDGQSHVIVVQDLGNPSCSISTNITTPDCNASTCALTLSAQETSGCDANDEVNVELTIGDTGGGASGFNVLLDGNNVGTFNYSGTGSTVVNINIPGDGQVHNLQVVDIDDPSCSTNTDISTTNCTIPCTISNLVASTGSSTTHIVEVIDFDFVPKDITITSGDIIEWQWTGAVDHTATSDATSGPDSWDSGLIGQGATFQSPVLSTGVHPYYCVPHGAPGGVGMAGTITVQADCTNGNVSVNLSFDAQGGGFSGYRVTVDGLQFGTFDYDPSGSNSIAITIAGDGLNHDIAVEDIDNPNCIAVVSITTPDCNASTCALTLSAQETSGCDANDEVNVELTIGDTGGGASGFNVLLDGNNVGTFNYSGTGSTVVNINVPGDGQVHNLQVVDIDDPSCSTNTDISTTNCTIPCTISNLVASTGSSTNHIVEVIDFDFVPKDITITSGDIIEWQWTGAVDHTATSDATSGPDSWDSGLIGQGATFQSPVLSTGVHPYYCVPHGAPGGVGMAGTITVQADCTNGNVSVNLSFDAQGGGFSGFQVLLDGMLEGIYDYDPSGINNLSITVSGDGQIHNIIVQDLDNPTCLATTSITTPDCDASTCALTLSAQETSGCDANDEVNVELTIGDTGGGASGFNILLDGNNVGTFNYSGTGSTLVNINVPGDGQVHNFQVVDIDDPSCSANTDISTTNCTIPCTISNLVASTGSSTTHIVEVIDFDFVPKDITITSGDIIEWQWTGAVDHTATSDATSGPDSWDSGLIGQGATFQSPVLSTGVHPYYCVPHGAPGGVGMAGTITVQADCTNGNVSVNLSFDAQGGGFSGYRVTVDGLQVGTFDYDPSGSNSIATTVAGDGLNHDITVEDIDNPNCIAVVSITTPDCNASTCALTLSAQETSGCDANDEVNVELTIGDTGGGASGFNVLLDGNNVGTFNYSGTGSTVVNINVPGDGQVHNFQVVDIDDPSCSTNTDISTTNCTIPCTISNLVASTGSSTTHIVEVIDFDFVPKDITITSGDIIEWQWTGAVDHTATSDATSGPDSWDSGLIGQGATFQSPVLSTGVHPYYCVPHGAPGGVGMAGTITVQADCTNGNVSVNLSFDAQGGGFSGYRVTVDGLQVGTFDYDPSGSNSIAITVAGDGLNHDIAVEDIDNPNCIAVVSITTPDCNASTCALTLSAQETSGCDANDEVNVELTIGDTGGGASGFNVLLDGNNVGTFNYSGTGSTVVNINVPGDGQVHNLQVVDIDDPSCSTNTDISTTNCTIPCTISNLVASTGSSTTHIVEVIDFDFVPKDITITSGDIIEWQWTGAVDHTATSDATSGPDSWDSGLIGQGATFQSPVLSTGVHPYYCVPHGAPGGVGMAGTITVQADCTNGNVSVNLSFDAQGGGFSGYRVTVDGLQFGTFDYDPSGSNSIAITIAGDGLNHDIAVEDIDNPNCIAVVLITTPDCDASTCALTLSAQETSGCDANDEVNVELTIGDTGGGASGFNVLLDGNNVGTFNYSGTGSTLVNINVPGDGQVHNFQVVDIDDPSCSANTDITTTNCTIPCTISNLVASTGSSTTHIVEVIDFDFVPKDIMIREGDTVRFVWTGIIPHTTTSDIDSGVDSWDSGLLDQGATYDVVINNLGYHPYYCIPHGAPGGIGMAGSITVLPDCDENDQVAVQLSFEEMGGSFSGFQVLVDGNTYGSYNYDSSGTNSISINVTGDNQIHTITVIDLENNTCIASTSITTPDCNFTLPCNLDLSTINIGDCNEDEEVKISLNITSENIGNQGFNLFVDGNLWNGSPFEYNSSNQTMIDVTIIGDGQIHSFVVQDVEFVDCTDSLSIMLADCSEPCALNNLQLEAVNGIITTTHIVEVKDFDFAPKDLNINLGDQIRWEWTGIIPHTATSDANSGIDSWDSGLLNQGAIYEYTLETEGNHPYYCIPHGTPGGVGMAGTIFVNPPLADCQNGMGSINISFEVTNPGNNGFSLYIDNNLFEIYNYSGNGLENFNLSVQGDGQSHVIRIEDNDFPECVIEDSLVFPDCNIPTPCSISTSNLQIGECNEENDIQISFQLDYENVGSAYQIIIDGNTTPNSPISYSGNGSDLIEITLSGTGQEQIIEIQDIDSSSCSTTLNIELPICGPICEIQNLSVSSAPQRHIVEVKDFEFTPKDLEILIGDTIEFVWTGIIPHTVTSDVLSGDNSFDSGLLGQGASYELILTESGSHPYYCIPHGGPGGVGMAGSIQVLEGCNDEGEALVNVQFTTTNGSDQGYNVFLDGQFYEGPISYQNQMGANSIFLNISGDGANHIITVQDLEVDFCAASTNFTAPDCPGICEIQDLEANSGSNIIHEIEVRDFDFSPSNITVHTGETIRFNWTGQIPHSTTSDATTGVDAWDSGIIGQGSVYDIVIQEPGDHPYYCTPHGGPGGIGMAGNITALPNCENDSLNVQINFNITNGSDQGYNIFVDGVLYNTSPILYDDPMGNNSYTISIIGDGENHFITVQDLETNFCATTTQIQVSDCSATCSIENAEIIFPEPELHIIDVFDFGFNPQNITINLGDTLSFIWTGVIPHTVTSDATSGPDSFESGLLGQGATYELVLTTIGDHPYYCIPHGGPGGIGMAGTIHVVDPNCQNGFVSGTLQFTSSATGTEGYNIYIDGNITSDSPYSYAPNGENELDLQLLGDAQIHTIIIADVLDESCSDTLEVQTINCNTNCALSITASTDGNCSAEGDILYELSINSENPGSSFELSIDGILHPDNPFQYDNSGTTLLNILIPGDGQSHNIEVQDLDSLNCNTSLIVNTIDCSPDCLLSINAELLDNCDDEGNLVYQIQVDVTDPESNQFNIWVDNMILPNSPFEYTGGSTIVEITLAGQGQSYEIIVADELSNSCSDTLILDVPNCEDPCELSNLEITIDVPIVHEVEVRDFDFFPKDIIANLGDTVRFIWTGVIPHTATSDATSGDDVWNSGLLGQGAVYDLIINNVGYHPYYCIPHGSPGGIGMAGSITIEEDCDDGLLWTAINFQAENQGTQGFNILIDGTLDTNSPFDYSNRPISIAIPADGLEHHIQIIDEIFSDCGIDSTIIMPDCSDPCYGFEAKFDLIIDYANYSIDLISTTNGASSWSWDFGDGNNGNGEQIQYTFNEPGTYTICLTASNEECTDEFCTTITFEEVFCQALFEYSSNGLNFDFTDQSSASEEIIEWIWTIDDSIFSNDASPNYDFDTLGIFTVCLTINTNNCSSDTCIILDLSDPCLSLTPAFEYTINEEELSISFTDLSGGNPNQWLWGFGDGNTSNEQNPIHYFDISGTYTVCLLAQNTELNCNATYCEVIQVGIINQVSNFNRNLSLQVFPNPTSSHQQVWTMKGILEKDYLQLLRFNLYDMSGKTILQTSLEGRNEIFFSVPQPLAQGVYFVELGSANATYRAKLVIH